jgi:hypothetical protein
VSADDERAIFDEMGETAYGEDTWKAMKAMARSELRTRRIVAFVSNTVVLCAGAFAVSIMAALAYALWHWVTG